MFSIQCFYTIKENPTIWTILELSSAVIGTRLSHHLTGLGKKPFENKRSLLKTLWEKEELLVQAISPFPTMFSTLSKTEVIIFVTFNLSSANTSYLVRSKILSCGKGFSIHLDNFVLFSSNLKLSSANCFNLDQSKILSSGNGLKDKDVWCAMMYIIITFTGACSIFRDT